ncbi:stage III sporulation protein SpoAB [compost metagenome]
MIKLLGAILILASATLGGFTAARRFAQRPRSIRGLIAALQRLESEITYGYTPLPEAMGRIAAQSLEPLRSLFLDIADDMGDPHNRTAREAVERAVRSHWQATAMKAPERESLRQLSFTLGVSDRQDQANHIALALRQLAQEEQTAREEQAKYEKMSRSLGVLLGALIVILIF